MKAPKLVHYEVAVSPRFPSTHISKGEPTYFIEKILIGILGEQEYNKIHDNDCTGFIPKLHTCRKNYRLWEKRMKKVQTGRAVIDLFYWELAGGRFTPGNTKVVFLTLDNNSGCGVQQVNFIDLNIERPFIFGQGINSRNHFYEIAKNDGLSLGDFKSWFKGYDLSKPMAIIQFTKFRY